MPLLLTFFVMAAGLVASLLTLPVQAQDQPEFSGEQLEFFEKRIRPVLSERCFKCHGPQKQESKLRLDSREAVLQGGESGPAVIPGKLDAGELLLAISYDPEGYQMPPDGKLPDEQIADLRLWVEMGAPWPGERMKDEGGRMNEGMSAKEFARRAEHWSFQPLVRYSLPHVQHEDWIRSPVDRFILAKLEENGLSPAEEADRRTWLRRVYFDTIGLPPMPGEVEEFLADTSPGAEDRVIDRLLADPHFGERWGRHWLDLVRYAESRGHEFDYNVANPWHYRDYAIRALNDDVPYNRFVVEHIAGDLLKGEERGARSESGEEGGGERVHSPSTINHPPSSSDSSFPLREHPLTGANESIVATGWWFLGEWVHSPVDIRQDEADRFDNMIDVYSKTFLGLTVACARCHDHKFDPIMQKDFYALQGYLQSSAYRQVRFETMEHNRRIAEKIQELRSQTAKRVFKQLQEAATPVLDRLESYVAQSMKIAKAEMQGANAADKEPDAEMPSEEPEVPSELDPRILKRWVEEWKVSADESDNPFRPVFDQYVAAPAEPPRREQDKGKFICVSVNWPRFEEDHLILDANQFSGTSDAFRSVSEFLSDRIILQESSQKLIEFTTAPADVYWHYSPSDGQASDRHSPDPEPGKIGPWQTLLGSVVTPSFEIATEAIHCLIDGGVNVHLVVDSHYLINGPLHGSQLSEHELQAQWRWVRIETSRYKGHRAHLEFFTRPGEFCSISDVYLGESPPKINDYSQYSDRNTYRSISRYCNPADGEQYVLDMALSSFFLDLFELDTFGVQPVWVWEFVSEYPQLFGINTVQLKAELRPVFEEYQNAEQELQSRRIALSASAPAMMEMSGEDEYVFLRGNWKKRGDVVPRRFLEVFGGRTEQEEKSEETNTGNDDDSSSLLLPRFSITRGSGRYELARQMVDPQQTPILARVIVNRIWQHYFGRGIVNSPDDFGFLGQAPSHPKLLDWLATELIAHDWSLKHIHRLILSSAAYRMASEERSGVRDERFEGVGSQQSEDPSSTVSPSTINHPPSPSTPQRLNASTLDPDNILLHRMNVKRLEGEIIRDAIMKVSGRLDEMMYGKSTPVHLTPFMEGRGKPNDSGPVDSDGRRSLYIAVRRNFPDPFLQAFDFPNPHSTIGRRTVSNVPAQALALMNNPLVGEQSQRWASRILTDLPTDRVDARVDRMFLEAFSRFPSAAERTQAERFLVEQTNAYGSPAGHERVWADYAHVLFLLKEFTFVK